MLFIGGSWININSDSFGGSSYSSIYKKYFLNIQE